MSRFTESLPGGRRLRDGHSIYWWVEILAVAIFYFVYSTVRNTTAKARFRASITTEIVEP